MPKMVNLASFWKTEAYAQTVSILIGQKLVENATIETCKWDIFGWFSNNMRPLQNWKMFNLRYYFEINNLRYFSDNFISLAVHDIETWDIGTRSSNYLPPKWLMIRGFYQAAKSSCAGNGDFVFALTSTLKAYLARTTKIWFLLWFFIHFLISVPSFLPTTTTNSILTLYGQCRYTLF